MIGNYTAGVKEIPVCVGNGTQCLKITSQYGYPQSVLPRIMVTSFICFQHLALEGKRLMLLVPYIHPSVRCGLAAKKLIGCTGNRARVRSLEG